MTVGARTPLSSSSVGMRSGRMASPAKVPRVNHARASHMQVPRVPASTSRAFQAGKLCARSEPTL